MRVLAVAVVVVLAVACGFGGDPHDPMAEDPRPDLSVTLYEGGLELFMEYPAFVVGQDSPLVAHFTDTRDPDAFVWVTEGRVVATLQYANGGGEEEFVAGELLRNGIFKPVVRPTRAGAAKLTLELAGSPAAGVVHVGEVIVHPDVASTAPEDEAEPSEPVVSYLKESQWKTVYATAPAERRTLRPSVRATGEIRAPAGRQADFVSPFAGRFVADQPLLPGQAVRAGVVLGRIVALSADPGSITADKARADADLALAERAAERAESLYPTFVSARERDEARADVEAARARVAALSGGLEAWRGRGGAGFQIASPFDGRVAFVHVDPGDVVEAGVPVVSLIDATQLWLEARVFEGDHASVKGTQGAMVTVTGRDEPLVIDSSMGGEVVAVGAAVDPRDRTFPVVFAFPNPGDLVPGMMVKVKVFGTESRDVVAVPAASVIDDGGFPTVFVLDGGESFFKRRVVVGIRDGQLVEIVSGVAEGERVVSGGAWEVHLATTSGGIPEHGHQH